MASDAPAATTQELPPRALVIDDEPTIRSALRRYFTRKGWEVEEAADGAGGLNMLEDGGSRFRIVLCDLRMPGFSGIELHDELEATNPKLLSCFVFTTGDVSSPEAVAFLKRTRCMVLQKPFELRSLDDIVSRSTDGSEP